MKHFLQFASVLVILTVLLSFPTAVRADVSPPPKAPGANPGPGDDSTQVRMVSEVVVIDVLADNPPRAHITASFTMRNLGSTPENMAARFPIGGMPDMYGVYPECKNLGIKINDKVVPYRRITEIDPVYGKDAPWAEFDASFPAGEDVSIKVSYDLDGTEWGTSTKFYYIVETGAGWNGTIGSATFILRLPYEANLQNVLLDPPDPNAHFSGREVQWMFTDFEPDYNSNMGFTIVQPAIWNQTVIAQDNLSRNPQDGESWGQLGKAYKDAYFGDLKGYARRDEGASVLFEWSRRAYEKAVTCDPEDGLWHAGYADLFLRAYEYFGPDLSEQEKNLMLTEVQRALELAPTDPVVQDVASRASYFSKGQISIGADGLLIFNTATAAPPAQPTPTEKTARMPTATPILPSTQTKLTQTPQPSASPICGGTALILLPVALAIWNRKRK